MRFLVENFLKGCLVLVPTVGALYVVYFMFITIDGLLPFDAPGVGFVATLAAVTALGAFTSNVIGQRIFRLFERLLVRVPVVKLIYRAMRDFVAAFVGERRSFDQPVLVDLSDASGCPQAMGFATTDDLGRFGLSEHIAVYLPQSMNFAGHLIVVPSARVRPLDVDPTEFMAFVVSAGVVRGRPTLRPPAD